MQKSAISNFFKATTRAASSSATQASNRSAAAVAATSPWSSSSSAGNKQVMRMRIRVNCAGIVQTSHLSSSSSSSSSSAPSPAFNVARFIHTSRNVPRADQSFHQAVSFSSFSPEVHAHQGTVSVAGSNISYESIVAEDVSSNTTQKLDEFHVGQVFGPSDATVSKA